MRVQYDSQPPNLPAILAVLPDAARKDTIITYGDVVYVFGNTLLSPSLIAHEAVHSERQLEMGPDKWWNTYLSDKAFRLGEELLGHRAEYVALRKRHGPKGKNLETVARRLSSKLYGEMLTLARAKALILEVA